MSKFIGMVLFSFTALNWSKSTIVYLILRVCAMMFMSDFALVATCTVKGIVRYRRYGSCCVKMYINWDIPSRWVDGGVPRSPYGVGREFSGPCWNDGIIGVIL